MEGTFFTLEYELTPARCQLTGCYVSVKKAVLISSRTLAAPLLRGAFACLAPAEGKEIHPPNPTARVLAGASV
jgi:hypothetical protein